MIIGFQPLSIEEEIKQKRSFVNIHEKAVVNVMYTHSWVIEQMRVYFKRYGITIKQYNILRILTGANGPLSTSQVRERMLDKMSDTTRLVDRMIKKGWVEKKVSSSDRRLVDIMITDHGLDLLDQVNDIHDKSAEIMGNLSEEEIEQLSLLLDKIRNYRVSS